MSEAPPPPGRYRIPVELWVAIGIVLVCLGAYFGPQIHRRLVVNRAVSNLFAAQDHGEIATGLCGLIGRRDLAADAALAHYAASCPGRLWLPEKRVFVWLIDEGTILWAAPGLGRQPHGVQKVANGMALEELFCRGENLEITFSLDDKLAARLGVAKGVRRRAIMPITTLVAPRGAAQILFQTSVVPEISIVTTNSDFFARNWLRLVENEPSDPGVAPGEQAIPAKE